MKLVDEDNVTRDFFVEMSKYSGHLWKSHIERHLAIYELYKKSSELPGSVAEFGVHNGSTYFFLARLLEIFHKAHFEKYQSCSHHLYGFDTFEGIVRHHKEDETNEAGVQNKLGGFNQNKDIFFKDLETFKTNTEIADRLHVIEGDACLTFPKFSEENPGVRFRFVLMDFDIYEPTKVVLESIINHMVPGGIIAFDEYAFPGWPGETKAVDEFIKKHGLKLKSVSHTFAPSAYTVIE